MIEGCTGLTAQERADWPGRGWSLFNQDDSYAMTASSGGGGPPLLSVSVLSIWNIPRPKNRDTQALAQTQIVDPKSLRGRTPIQAVS